MIIHIIKKWNFIEPNSTIIDFINELKSLKLEDSIDYFFVNNKDENVIIEITDWLIKQYDNEGNSIYTQDFNWKLNNDIQDDSQNYLIFFRNKEVN